MERITVDKHNLNLLIDDIDESASYIEELVNWAYYDGHNDGWDDCCTFYEITRNNEETGDI